MRTRLDELLSIDEYERTLKWTTDKSYNLEYYMNRGYALNRDKLKCRVCGKNLCKEYGSQHAYPAVKTHRIDPSLNISLINRVNNLAEFSLEKGLERFTRPLQENGLHSPQLMKKRSSKCQ